MFWSYTNKFKCYLRVKHGSRDVIDMFSSEDMKNIPPESWMWFHINFMKGVSSRKTLIYIIKIPFYPMTYYIENQQPIVSCTCIPNNVIKTNKFLKLKKKIFVCDSRKRIRFHLSEVKLSIFITFYKQLKGAKLKSGKDKTHYIVHRDIASWTSFRFEKYVPWTEYWVWNNKWHIRNKNIFFCMSDIVVHVLSMRTSQVWLIQCTCTTCKTGTELFPHWLVAAVE